MHRHAGKGVLQACRRHTCTADCLFWGGMKKGNVGLSCGLRCVCCACMLRCPPTVVTGARLTAPRPRAALPARASCTPGLRPPHALSLPARMLFVGQGAGQKEPNKRKASAQK